jgi:hypothetical protein
MTRVSDHHKVKTAFIGGSIKLPPEWPVWVIFCRDALSQLAAAYPPIAAVAAECR